MKAREVAIPRSARSPSLAAHEVFVRRAREAAHQALFLLLHVRSTRFRAINRVLARGLEFTFVQARALIQGVAIPQGTSAEAAAYFEPRTVAPLGQVGQLGARGATIFGAWGAVQDTMNAGAPPQAAHVPPAIAALRDFLVLSRPKPLTLGMLDHVRMTVVRQLARRLTTLVAAALVLFVLLEVEVVHNLIWNDTRKTPAFLLLTIGLSLTLWFIPLVAFFLSGFVGARAFWGLRALPPERGVQRWPPDGGAGRFVSFAYTLTAIALLAWFGVFMWMGKIGVLAEGRLTVFTTLSMLWAAVFAAHVLDRWAFMERRSVRLTVLLFALILGGLVIFSQGASSPRTESALRVVAVGILLLPIGYEIWRAAKGIGSRVTTAFLTVVYLGMAAGILEGAHLNHDRVWRNAGAGAASRPLVCATAWPYAGDADWPAILVAASGGGSRAAYFTARTLEMLNQIEIDDEPTAIAAHIQAISSVSGGSLASAVYIARGYRQARGRTLPPPPATPSFVSKAAVNLQAVKQSAPVPPTGAVTRRPPSALARGLANAVKDDYLWPTIKGFLWPGTTRGDSIEAAWEENPAALRGVDLADLASAWNGYDGDAPPFPMPLFNACTLDAQDVVLTPLPHTLYSDGSTLAIRALRAYYGLTCSTPGCSPPDLTWVADRDGIYGLEQLLPTYTPSLARAVRASANFPYGFPLVHLEVPAHNLVLSPRYRSDDASAVSVKLTDGGALSNSGMWSLYQLMTLRASITTELKRRGVLLVIVNASSMPVYGQERSDLLALGSTIQNNNPRGQYLHREMLARLERDYGDGIRIVQLDLTPTEQANVLTTWSMDAISLQATENEFSKAEKREKEHLAAKWRALRARLLRAGPSAVVAHHPRRDCEPPSVSDDAPLPDPIEAYKVRPPLN